MQIHRPPLETSHHQVAHILRVVKLTLHAHGISVGADVERAAGHIAVLGSDHLRDSLYREMISLEFDWVDIDVYLAFRRARDAHRADAVDARQRIGHRVIKNLV